MKTGTFLCWLWGHKFLVKKDFKEDGLAIYWKNQTTDFCVRCGIKNNS